MAAVASASPVPFADKENFTTATPSPKGIKGEFTVAAPSPRCLLPRRRHGASRRAAEVAVTDPAVRRRAENQLARSLVATNAGSSGSSAPMATGPSLTLSLPPLLPRPTFREIKNEQLAAHDPTWAQVPLPYIRDRLEMLGSQLLRNISISCSSVSASHGMPTSVDVTFGASATEEYAAPTHLLSVYTAARRRPTNSPIASTLVPVHAEVLVAYCAHLPTLPTAAILDPPAPGSTRTLPVVPLRLPAQRETFWPLLRYLYTKSRAALLAELLPGPPPPPESEDPAAHFVEHCDRWSIARALLRVHALWANVCALGAEDDGLWSTMSCAYSILREAAARTNAHEAAPPADAMDVC